MPDTARDLSVHYEQNGSFVCAFTDAEAAQLEILKKRGEANGVPQLEIIAGRQLFGMEPNLSREIKAALYAPAAGIICPYFLTVAAVECAVLNGCDLFLNFEAVEVKNHGDFFTLKNPAGKEINAKFIINSAGLYSDDIAKLCGENIEAYKITPRKGEYMLLDKTAGSIVRATLFAVPSAQGKGILVAPTIDGNLIIGPTAAETDKEDVSTTAEGLAEIQESAKRLVPGLNMRQVITSFSGVRSTPKNHDFNIFISGNALHLVGIESPGLAASPAIAGYAADLLKTNGLKLIEKSDFKSVAGRKKAFRDMSDAERAEAIRGNNLYANIICRCETVTEAEIIDFIKSACPAENLDAVKRRTRAGMGRCQGGFCSPRIVEILARELGVDMLEITKKGAASHILTGRTK
jgi:glycerol-3-phosphate dehydrogenase